MSPEAQALQKGTLTGREAAVPALYLSFSLDLADLVLKASPSECVHCPKLRASIGYHFLGDTAVESQSDEMPPHTVYTCIQLAENYTH